MKIFNLFDGELSVATPRYRYVHRSRAKPGLSFTHPADGPANWRVVLPLGARDFYTQPVECPTNPAKSAPNVCRWCGNPIDATGHCHGEIPSLPPLDQEYVLFRLPVKDNQPHKACEYILTLPDPERVLSPSTLILWDDSGLGDSVSYKIDGRAQFIGYGHDVDDVSITVYPVVVVTGKATLTSCMDNTFRNYNFDENASLSIPATANSAA